jgi:hypothetical protein
MCRSLPEYTPRARMDRAVITIERLTALGGIAYPTIT